MLSIHRYTVLSTFLWSLILAQQDPRLETAIVTDTPVNGISTTPEGRQFLLYARVDGSTGPTVVESIGNTLHLHHRYWCWSVGYRSCLTVCM
jgi:hypothetical protein